LFLGTGVAVWNLATELGTPNISSLPVTLALQLYILSLCHGLYGLAINTVLAGSGVVVAIWLRKGKEAPNQRMVATD
jgi:hypothetical protein